MDFTAVIPAVAGVLAVAVLKLRSRPKPRVKGQCPASNPEEEPTGTPLFRFGILGDVQYADSEDAWDFDHTHLRHYRGSLNSVIAGVSAWNATGPASDGQPPVSFAVQMGDVIDGRCAKGGPEASRAAMDTVVTELRKFNGVVYDVIGNHELYNFSRAELLEQGLFAPVLKSLRTAVGGRLTPSCAATVRMYYDFSPCPGWRCIVLDTYDQGVIGDPDLRSVNHAFRILEKHNPNDTRAMNVDWFQGLRGLPRRFVPYNGGVGTAQLAWFRCTLRDAAARGEYVIVFGHVPVCVGSCRSKRTLCWNYEEVLDAMHTDGGGRVVAYFAGHAHQGGYNIDSHGVHHRTIESPLEVAEGKVAFATIAVHDRKCECSESCRDRDVALVLKMTDIGPPLLVMRGQRVPLPSPSTR